MDNYHLHELLLAAGFLDRHDGCYLGSIQEGDFQRLFSLMKAPSLLSVDVTLSDLDQVKLLTELLTQQRGAWQALALDSIKRMRAGHVECADLSIQAEDLLAAMKG